MSASMALGLIVLSAMVGLLVVGMLAKFRMLIRDGIVTDDTVAVAVGLALFLPAATFIITYAALR